MNPNELQVAINEQQNAPLQLAKHTRFYCAKDIAAGLTRRGAASADGKNWGYTPAEIAMIAFAIVDALVEEANRAP